MENLQVILWRFCDKGYIPPYFCVTLHHVLATYMRGQNADKYIIYTLPLTIYAKHQKHRRDSPRRPWQDNARGQDAHRWQSVSHWPRNWRTHT